MRFLFVRSEFCLRLPSDSVSRRTPLPLATASRCRARSGLSPYRTCARRAHRQNGRHPMDVGQIIWKSPGVVKGPQPLQVHSGFDDLCVKTDENPQVFVPCGFCRPGARRQAKTGKTRTGGHGPPVRHRGRKRFRPVFIWETVACAYSERKSHPFFCPKSTTEFSQIPKKGGHDNAP